MAVDVHPIAIVTSSCKVFIWHLNRSSPTTVTVHNKYMWTANTPYWITQHLSGHKRALLGFTWSAGTVHCGMCDKKQLHLLQAALKVPEKYKFFHLLSDDPEEWQNISYISSIAGQQWTLATTVQLIQRCGTVRLSSPVKVNIRIKVPPEWVHSE